MRIFKLTIVSIVAFAFFSCEPTYKKEYSWAYPIAGDWTLKAYVDGDAVAGPFEVKSYNSSFGKDSVWFDDYATTSSNGHFWSFKFKAKVDVASKTFSTVGSKNAITGYPIKITVTNGKIIGTDSLTMDVVFADDAATTYQLKGHRTTSYEEYMGE
ncbi:MAG: hypothetical protein JZU53_09140 [Paludibacter sp.]|jgi:hypothetical protein|nr:hypothetical protein [Paludibacter sp.]